MWLFGRKETNEEIRKRILKLTDQEDYGLCPPSLKAQVALDELCNYLLGDDWYVVSPIHCEQVNTEIVYDIECKYKQHKKYKHFKIKKEKHKAKHFK